MNGLIRIMVPPTHLLPLLVMWMLRNEGKGGEIFRQYSLRSTPDQAKTMDCQTNGEHRLVHYDRAPQSRVYKVWNTPGWGMDESLYLDLFADVLASGKNSAFTNAWCMRIRLPHQ